jgi:hypothetical protein
MDFLARTAVCLRDAYSQVKCAHSEIGINDEAQAMRCPGPCRIPTCCVGALRETVRRTVRQLREIEAGDEPDIKKDFPFRLLVSRLDDSELALREEASRHAAHGLR